MAAGVSGRDRRVMQSYAGHRFSLWSLARAVGLIRTSLKQNISNSLHLRGVKVLSVMFVPPAAEYSDSPLLLN